MSQVLKPNAQTLINAQNYQIACALSVAYDAARELLNAGVPMYEITMRDSFVHMTCGDASAIPGVAIMSTVYRVGKTVTRASLLGCVLEWEGIA